MAIIFHITSKSAWQTAVDSYLPAGFKQDGFIHCSTINQVLKPANEIYRGQTDLVLLCIDEEKVAAAIIYEDCYDTGEKFPHIYGRLNIGAVQKVVDFPPQPDGSFSLPPNLSAP